MADNSKQTIAVVLYPGVTALHVVGMMHAGQALGGRYGFVAVGATRAAVATDTPLQYVPQATFGEAPAPAGLVVPGAAQAEDTLRDEQVVAYVRSAAERATFVVGLGSGVLALAAVGLLRGRAATTHWALRERLEGYGTRFVRAPRVEDGKFITAGGLSSGVDVALWLGARLNSPAAARNVQLFMEYSPEPPFGGLESAGVAADLYSRAGGSSHA